MLRLIIPGLLLLTISASAQKPCVIDSLLPIVSKMEDDTAKVRQMLDICRACKYERTDEAITCCNNALTLANTLGFERYHAQMYINLGFCYYYKQDYPNALSYFFKALSYAEKYNDNKYIGACYINIGNQHHQQGNYSLAKAYYLKALMFSKKTDDYKTQVDLWNNLGMIEGQLENYDQAIVYLKKAISLARQQNIELGSANALNNLGIAYTHKKEYDEALKCQLEGLRIHTKYNDSRGIANSCSDIGTVYFELKNYDQAMLYFRKGLKETEQTGFVKLSALIYEMMSKVCYQTGDYKNAYLYYQQFKQINDSLYSEEKAKQFSELNIQYETGKKDHEITSLKTENLLKETLAKKQSLIIIIFVVAMFVFIILSALLSKNIKSKKRANATLQKQNLLITQQKTEIENQKKELENYTEQLEKENILAQYEALKNQVNPHFLFNSLNALGSLIKKDPAEAYKFTKEFSKIYRVVLELKEHSLIHLSEELDFIKSYLFLQMIRFGDNLKVDINIPSQYLDHFIPPFSLQLVVENAIKHNIISEEQPLHIEIYYEGNRLVVRNNLQIRSNFHGSTGVGSKNMELRYKLISAEEPEFYTDAQYYYVRLPLVASE